MFKLEPPIEAAVVENAMLYGWKVYDDEPDCVIVRIHRGEQWICHVKINPENGEVFTVQTFAAAA